MIPMGVLAVERGMPLQSLVIVGTIIALLVVFAGTLAWVRWYGAAPPLMRRVA
jgi:hypothetical protein